jgi:hypothetical protein
MQQIRPHAPSASDDAEELIALAQKLARDAERHALLSESLASQADRLMHAGLQKRQARAASAASQKSC